MIPRTAFFVRLAPALLLACAALGGLLPSDAPAQPPVDKTKQINDIEKQIADLQKKLEYLKKSPSQKPAPEPSLPDNWVKPLGWRSIGPASMGGRIVALAVCESDPSLYWVATASGGLLKTINNGVTFEHQFDRETTVSIGDVAVAPSNKNIVWVGTGENNPRNSVSYGDGVYKSENGGAKWTNMGLKKTFQIGKIVIHPKNPDIVYVGALGRLYGPSEERGLFKTTDGGKTWSRVLFIDENTGVIDIAISPTDPDTLVVAAWERRRDAFDSHAGALAGAKVNDPMPPGHDSYDPVVKWGKSGGIYRTTDGGKNFAKVTKGLPSVATGRIGLDTYRKNPKVLFAVIDTERIGQGPNAGYLGVFSEASPKGGARIADVTTGSPAEKAGLKKDDVITAIGKTPLKTTRDLTRVLAGSPPDSKIVVVVNRGDKSLSFEVTLISRASEQTMPVPGFTVNEKMGVQTLPPNSLWAKAGLRLGDVVVALNETKVASPNALASAYRPLKPGQATLTALRGKETVTLRAALPVPSAVNRPYAAYYGGQRDNVQDLQGPNGADFGGVFRSDDGGESWRRINSVNPRPMYFSQVRVDPSDDKFLYILGVRLHRSTDGGATFEPGGDSSIHPDHHAMWINPRDGRHILIGTDGGSYVTYDRCDKWDFLATKAIGQFYHVTVDQRKPYNVYGGLQDNGSWGGPNLSLDGRGTLNADWRTVQGGDGFVCRVDPVDPDIVYTESQEGNLFRRNVKTGSFRSIRPRPQKGEQPYRFNWNTPFIISSHNPAIVYVGGNYVFRSVKRGDDAKAISPELTPRTHASATAVAESPVTPEVLWAGTDDGHLWVTKNGGEKWSNVAAKVKLPGPYWVATIEPSRDVAGRCYVCFDAHRSDDDEPYVYVTEDYGETWKSLRSNLPTALTRVLREDLFNPNVLYLGTEFVVWASIDRGVSWTKINNNLPTVAIHELAQHPTAGEMVAATHGRSLWALDVTPLRQLKPETRREAATLLGPNTVTRWRREARRGTMYGIGNREYFAENPAPGAHIYYVLGQKNEKVRLEVQDFAGKVLSTLQTVKTPGLHKATWSMQGTVTGSGVEGMGPTKGFGGFLKGGAGVPAGTYKVVLTVNGKEQVRGLKVENDPTLNERPLVVEEELKRKPRLADE